MRKFAPFAVLIALCGCGQTGPLYMPGEAAPVSAENREEPQTAEDLQAVDVDTIDTDTELAEDAPEQQD